MQFNGAFGATKLEPFLVLNESFYLKKWLNHRKSLVMSGLDLIDKKAGQQIDPNMKTLWHFLKRPFLLLMLQIETEEKT